MSSPPKCRHLTTGSLDESGLLQVGAKVEFRHPLVRSAVYRFAALGARRSVHGALADVTDPELDPDRRAWHHALAAPGPDEQVAVELEQSADRAQARGGYAAEAAFAERALTLTADFGRRGARALAAARARLAAGQPRTARDLLSVAERGPLDKLGSAQLEVLRARIAFALGRGRDAPVLLLKAAKSLEPLDPIEARDTYLDAISAVLFAGRFAQDTHLRDVAAAARGAAWPDMPRVPDLLLRAFATLIVDGYSAGTPLSQQTVAALRHGEFSSPRDLGWLVLGALLAVTLWDEDGYEQLAQRQLRIARETGALDVLPIILTNRAIAHILAGEFAAAASLIEEIEVVSEATGIPLPPYAAVATAVYRQPAFTDRAARELAATGETVRKRPGDGGRGSDLTVREAQIARLAADGLSNREIGEQLFISHRTVGYHLGRVFSKLDVANRAQLHNALDRARSS